jgi:hypothetical protein
LELGNDQILDGRQESGGAEQIGRSAALEFLDRERAILPDDEVHLERVRADRVE